jgi:hypothetical protein
MSFSGYGRHVPFDRMTPDAALQTMTGRTPTTTIGCAGPAGLLPTNALASGIRLPHEGVAAIDDLCQLRSQNGVLGSAGGDSGRIVGRSQAAGAPDFQRIE